MRYIHLSFKRLIIRKSYKISINILFNIISYFSDVISAKNNKLKLIMFNKTNKDGSMLR